MDELARHDAGTVEGGTDTFGPAGTQTIVGLSPAVEPLAVLPDQAYDNLLVVTVRDHPNKLQRRIEHNGHDPSKVGVVPVVPAVKEYEGDLWTTDPVSPDDLTGVGMRFSDAIKHVEGNEGWVFVDALGVLPMYAENSQVCRFFQTITNRVRAKDVRGIYCVNPTAVGEESYEQFRAMCDAELRFD